MISCEESIINRIIKDTESGKLGWSCGAHSDIWSATCSNEYYLEEIPGAWFGIDLQISFTNPVEYAPIHIGWSDWRRIKRLIRHKHLVELPRVCERMKV